MQPSTHQLMRFGSNGPKETTVPRSGRLLDAHQPQPGFTSYPALDDTIGHDALPHRGMLHR